MKNLLIKSVFCPSKIYFKNTLKSLIKINMFMQLKNIKFDLLLIGWIHIYDKIINKILRTIKLEFCNVFTEFWTINYGKYKILNYSIDFVKNKPQYKNIIYMDHDVHFDFLSDIDFKNLDDLINTQINSKNIGLIAFNQKGDNRHQPSIYENSYLNLVWPSHNGAIATGSFITSLDNFIKLEKFELCSVYGLDDYILCEKLRNMNLINVVISDNFVIHPFDNNEKYNLWKKNNIINTINNNINNYYRNIEESMNVHLS